PFRGTPLVRLGKRSSPGSAPTSWLLRTRSSDPVDGGRVTALAAERQPAAGAGGQLRFVHFTSDADAEGCSCSRIAERERAVFHSQTSTSPHERACAQCHRGLLLRSRWCLQVARRPAVAGMVAGAWC